jgi:hypothetical protein
MRVCVGATVCEAKGTKVRIAPRIRARERRAALKRAKNSMALWAAQLHHLFYLPPHRQRTALLLGFGRKVGLKVLSPLPELGLQCGLLAVVNVPLQHLKGRPRGCNLFLMKSINFEHKK